jgi:hypothetical protein
MGFIFEKIALPKHPLHEFRKNCEIVFERSYLDQEKLFEEKTETKNLVTLFLYVYCHIRGGWVGLFFSPHSYPLLSGLNTPRPSPPPHHSELRPLLPSS